ncbi:MAG: DEAD/DEAH box helicase [Acidimicrobiia bacterium]|nr:DEAD/DEAH box helicase [Acidimicrobiia bacterium]
MTTTFADLGLPDSIVRVLSKRGIVEPFPVQEATIPDVLAGRDVSGKAPTGSGKTLAFGLPLLARVDKASSRRPRALVLAPTRELAEQIKTELMEPAKAVGRYVLAIYGGVRYDFQIRGLRKGVDLLVATPGRLEDLIEQGAADLSQVDIVVIDEADRMADMGFMPAVRRILDHTPRKRQTLLFSATLDGDIAVLSRDYQRDPVRHEAGTVESVVSDAQHHFWLVQHHDRVRHAADLVDAAGRTIVFTRTRHGADRLAKQLGKEGIEAVAMHGGRSQSQRNRALSAFSSGRAQALIATDVAARGIHVDAVSSVLHFDPPADSKDYVHRSGRTARAGAAGNVVSFVTGDQKRNVRRIQKELDLGMPFEDPRPDVLRTNGRAAAHAPRELRSGPATHHSPAADSTLEGVHSVYVANLPWQMTGADLERMFAPFGEVSQTAIITDKRSGRSKGFGFVDMQQDAADSAISALHGSMVEGRDLTVRMARPRQYS